MRSRSSILRCVAFCFLLIFSQKAGTGLLLHNLLHAKQIVSHTAGQQEIGFACNCIDDFLMPFEETDTPVFSSPILLHESPVAFFSVTIPFRNPVFSSLRGPPARLS